MSTVFYDPPFLSITFFGLILFYKSILINDLLQKFIK